MRYAEMVSGKQDGPSKQSRFLKTFEPPDILVIA